MSWLAILFLQILFGWLLADLLSGVLHWLEDNFGNPDWPLIGAWVIAPNRQHHDRPLAFTGGGFVSRNSTTVAAVLVFACPLYLIFGPAPWLLAATLGGLLTNQVHYWAHTRRHVPALVRAFQSVGIFQSSSHHQRHHARPHDRRYCILTNWINPVADCLGLWAAIERLVPSRWRA